MEYLAGQVVVGEQRQVTLHGGVRQARVHRLDVQGILPGGIGQIALHRLGNGQIEELFEEDDPCHAVQLFGQATQALMKMLAQGIGRHQVQQLTAKQPRPVRRQVLDGHRRKHRRGRVEQGHLSRIDGVSHFISNLRVNRKL